MKKTPVNPVNRKRRRRLFLEQYGESYGDWIRSMPCIGCGRLDEIQASHVQSKGAGGKKDSLVPMCFDCHSEYGRGRHTFERRHDIDLELEAYRLRKEYDLAA